MKKDVNKIMWSCKATAPLSAKICLFVSWCFFFLEVVEMFLYEQKESVKECVVGRVVVMEKTVQLYNFCMVSRGVFHASRGQLENMKQMHLHSVNRRRESSSAYHLAGCTQMLSRSLGWTTCHSRSLTLMTRVHFCKKCYHDKLGRGFRVSKDFKSKVIFKALFVLHNT